MTRIPVISSNVKSVGYDSKTRVLEVEFLNKSVYQYSSVPKTIYSEMLMAQSIGKYLNEHVKGIYSYEKIK